MKKKLSIQNIAEHLKVSTTTVSWVLNGKAGEKGISKRVEKMILKYVEQVGYRPNRMAQGLRTGKSKTIGILIEDISDAFFSSIARTFEKILGDKGYRIVYGSTENKTNVALELIDVFKNHQVDGFIIAPAPGIENAVRELIEDKIPVVIIDRPLKDQESHCVLVDNYTGTLKAMRHFLDNGFKNVAMITLSSDQLQMQERERGYNSVLNEVGIVSRVVKIKYHENKETVVEEIINFLTKNPDVDGLFFATNYLAEAGLEAIIRTGREIPDQLGVITFDDASLFRLLKPSITAIDQPIDGICTQAVHLLLEQMSHETKSEPRVVQLSTTLVVRQSTTR